MTLTRSETITLAQETCDGVLSVMGTHIHSGIPVDWTSVTAHALITVVERHGAAANEADMAAIFAVAKRALDEIARFTQDAPSILKLAAKRGQLDLVCSDVVAFVASEARRACSAQSKEVRSSRRHRLAKHLH